MPPTTPDGHKKNKDPLPRGNNTKSSKHAQVILI